MSTTPRPTLDVVNLNSPLRVYTARKRQLRRALDTLTKEEKKLLSRVMSRYRRKQKKLLGHTETDPDPYDADYVFYCLEGTRND